MTKYEKHLVEVLRRIAQDIENGAIISMDSTLIVTPATKEIYSGFGHNRVERRVSLGRYNVKIDLTIIKL
jgi:hypothetical protein